MRPTKVLFVTASPERGGAEQVVLELLNGLDRRRIDPVVVALAHGPLVDELRQTGVPVLDAGTLARMRNVGRIVAVANRLAAQIRHAGVELVHSHGTTAHLTGGLAAWRAGVPAMHHVQDIYTHRLSVEGMLQRVALRVPAAAIVAASHAIYLRVLDLGAPRSRVTMVHNGVSLASAPPAPGVSSPSVVWCGRLQRWKGAHVFLEAARAVKDAHPHARFWVVGGTLFGMEAEYAEELKAQASALGLGDDVTFTGHVADARPYLAAADVAVHCSLSPEPFGLVVAEAMAQGRAVVAFDEGGPAEMIESGLSGKLVAPGSAEALASAISDLLARPELRARLGDGARRRARHFSVEAMVRRMHVVYDHVRRPRARTDKHA